MKKGQLSIGRKEIFFIIVRPVVVTTSAECVEQENCMFQNQASYAADIL